jgi:hypothetical protein
MSLVVESVRRELTVLAVERREVPAAPPAAGTDRIDDAPSECR